MAEYKEPIFDVAQLAHMELLTPKPDETLWFFKELLGMQESGREGQSVYLRAYEDFYHHTLKVTESSEAGMGHAAWRTRSPQALERRVEAVEATGLGKGWSEGDQGHGPAYRFDTPGGHKMELLWDVDYFEPAKEQRTKLINRPQKRPLKGMPVRRLDHINLLDPGVTPTRDFLMDQLGFQLRENAILNDGSEPGAWLSVSALAHEIALTGERAETSGRLHHVCYWYGYPQHLLDIADICVENDIHIEAGPGKHGITQAHFLYVLGPGGNRVELFGDPGYLIFDPDWKTITWTEEDLDKGLVWVGATLPVEFFLYGTPVVQEAHEDTSVPPE